MLGRVNTGQVLRDGGVELAEELVHSGADLGVDGLAQRIGGSGLAIARPPDQLGGLDPVASCAVSGLVHLDEEAVLLHDPEQLGDDQLCVVNGKLVREMGEGAGAAQVSAERRPAGEVDTFPALSRTPRLSEDGGGPDPPIRIAERPHAGQMLLGLVEDPFVPLQREHVHVDRERAAHLVEHNAGEFGAMAGFVVTQGRVCLLPELGVGGDLVQGDVVELQ